jgi:hypothetical protein
VSVTLISIALPWLLLVKGTAETPHPPPAVRVDARARKETKMILSEQAFHLAQDAIAGRPCHDSEGSVTVDRLEASYVVRFYCSGPHGQLGHPGQESIRVSIDAHSGKVIQLEQRLKSRPEVSTQLISPKRAYDEALRALGTFHEYDKFGRLLIRLNGDRYEVTFPLPPEAAGGSRAPDYAMQVWIEAKSGTVLKVLTAS